MKKFRSFPIYSVGLAALSVLGTAQISQAVTLSAGNFPEPFNLANVTLNDTEIDGKMDTSGTFNLFDPSLGNLNSITVSGLALAEGSIALTNNATTSQTVNGDTNVNVFLKAQGIDLGTLQASFETGFQSIPAGQTIVFDDLSGNNSGTFNIDPANFSLFTGVGTFEATCTSLSGGGTTGGGGQISFDQTTQAGCGVDIVYDYKPDIQVTPEASSLLGLSLIGGLGLLGAKSRKKQA